MMYKDIFITTMFTEGVLDAMPMPHDHPLQRALGCVELKCFHQVVVLFTRVAFDYFLKVPTR